VPTIVRTASRGPASATSAGRQRVAPGGGDAFMRRIGPSVLMRDDLDVVSILLRAEIFSYRPARQTA
jgi:hypothetical protein